MALLTGSTVFVQVGFIANLRSIKSHTIVEQVCPVLI